MAATREEKTTVTTTSSSSPTTNRGSFTTPKETVTFKKEIKKSKFIAIAGSISNEQSAHSFLNQVKDMCATHNCWAYKVSDTTPFWFTIICDSVPAYEFDVVKRII
ncbi:geminivirus Rep-interacting motor protein-like [Hibiscus syriacus]|uniref:Geminivirus Rep-interacting motor protein-like n=1 Tax=Hibiscus syriacus TaxID=106335 RepID=A0A6A2ZZB4_HIBSY|nr:geminivirus Rep-interacting motor protein-like [Hibiscus syriacus]